MFAVSTAYEPLRRIQRRTQRRQHVAVPFTPHFSILWGMLTEVAKLDTGSRDSL